MASRAPRPCGSVESVAFAEPVFIYTERLANCNPSGPVRQSAMSGTRKRTEMSFHAGMSFEGQTFFCPLVSARDA